MPKVVQRSQELRIEESPSLENDSDFESPRDKVFDRRLQRLKRLHVASLVNGLVSHVGIANRMEYRPRKKKE